MYEEGIRECKYCKREITEKNNFTLKIDICKQCVFTDNKAKKEALERLGIINKK